MSVVEQDAERIAKVREVLAVLAEHGVDAVCCGGAARDTKHGRVPKDYDIVILGDDKHLYDKVLHALRCTRLTLIEFNNKAEYASAPSLEFVIKAGPYIDVLAFSEAADTPTELVEGLDCTLNMAWFNENWEVEVHRLYPFPGDMVAMLPNCDDPVNRSYYLGRKYLEYQWPFNPSQKVA